MRDIDPFGSVTFPDLVLFSLVTLVAAAISRDFDLLFVLTILVTLVAAAVSRDFDLLLVLTLFNDLVPPVAAAVSRDFDLLLVLTLFNDLLPPVLVKRIACSLRMWYARIIVASSADTLPDKLARSRILCARSSRTAKNLERRRIAVLVRMWYMRIIVDSSTVARVADVCTRCRIASTRVSSSAKDNFFCLRVGNAQAPHAGLDVHEAGGAGRRRRQNADFELATVGGVILAATEGSTAPGDLGVVAPVNHAMAEDLTVYELGGFARLLSGCGGEDITRSHRKACFGGRSEWRWVVLWGGASTRRAFRKTHVRTGHRTETTHMLRVMVEKSHRNMHLLGR